MPIARNIVLYIKAKLYFDGRLPIVQNSAVRAPENAHLGMVS